ncbi:MAG TPA: superoxide dismutase [Cu-Zn] SodC1, partial [Pseudomonas sp.]|nr:superoxide dismutase [Cu-Zn] SodC1 [Pseudomonas sp.]
MKQWIIAALAGCTAVAVQADTLNVKVNAVTAQGVGESVGSVKIENSEYGLVFRPELSGLQPGAHGFHVHAKGSCEPAEIDGKQTPAGAAGGHWDPKNSGKHGEPWGDGHMGDLPAL